MDNDEIRKIASLACLALDDKEIEQIKPSLLDILKLVAQLEEGDDDTEPTFSTASGAQRIREDRVTESDQRDAFQRNAPATADGFYLVPKFIE